MTKPILEICEELLELEKKATSSFDTCHLHIRTLCEALREAHEVINTYGNHQNCKFGEASRFWLKKYSGV